MKPPTVPFRKVNMYVRFTPEGPDKGDHETFFEFYLAATERIQRNRARELACKRRDSKQFIEAMDKLD